MILAGSERLTTDAMVRSICTALGKPERCPHVPLWPFDIAARICETLMPPLGLKPPLHSRRLDFFRKSFRFSTERAARVLGFRSQVPFAQGAQLTADWYREAGLLT
jgi:nucleoside-diphosphate-sugar epimerase